MKDSIVINMEYADYDIIDGTPCAQRHHIFGGANRKLSDEDGLWVPVTSEHHTGKMSVHMNKEISVLMHIIGQLAYEKHLIATTGVTEDMAREEFRKRYKKSYL